MYDQEENDNFSVASSSNIQLTVINYNSIGLDQSFMEKVESMLSAIPVTNLQFDCKNMPIHILMNIVRVLPHLDSLKVSSFPLLQVSNLSNRDATVFHLISVKNKITKVNIEQTISSKQMISSEQKTFLFSFCPQMQYLQVGCDYDNNLMKVIQIILENNTTQNPYFDSICFYIPEINKKMIHPIQSMIDHKKLRY